MQSNRRSVLNLEMDHKGERYFDYSGRRRGGDGGGRGYEYS